MRSDLADRGVGLLLVALTALVACKEWQLGHWAEAALPLLVVPLVALLTFQVPPARRAFVLIAAVLSMLLWVQRPDWGQIVLRAMGSAAFIAAFFAALSTLRNVAQSSPSILAAGRFLSEQRPGRRYAALTLGGQAFALVLNYGAIQLLGTLAMSSAREDPDPDIRRHRVRRMLLAIQRGFASSLPWSPLSFAMAITTTAIPGADWSSAVGPGLVTALIMAGVGWAMDTIFKPRLTVTPRRTVPSGSWSSMGPLLVLLAVLGSAVTVLHLASGVRVAGVVMVVVPVLSLAWLWVQLRRTGGAPALRDRLSGYVFAELPGYRGELILLMMAGYIGTVGAAVLGPVLARAGVDLGSLPVWVLLLGFVWVVPLAGQIGMNPILAVTLIAPLVPAAAELGIAPAAIVTAITAGWALSGASSPFTATTLLIGSFAGISATRVGLVWNGAYTLLCGVILSAWVLVFGLWS